MKRQPQPMLFDTPPQPRGTPESDALYAAVMQLRKRGFRVYRGGRRVHLVEGERVNGSKMLIRLAWPA